MHVDVNGKYVRAVPPLRQASENILESPTRGSYSSRRLRVLEQAARTINAKGISQSSLGDIAQALGLTRPALYYYFRDQEDLVFQIYRRSCENLTTQIRNARQTNEGALAVCEAFFDAMLNEPEGASLEDIAYLPPDKRQTIIALYQTAVSELADAIKRGVHTGEIRECSAPINAHIIIGLTLAAVTGKRRWPGRRVEYSDMLEAIRTLLRYGVAADRGSPTDYTPIDLAPRPAASTWIFDARALAAAKHEATLASASWLFNLKGISATTLDEIAERVGVTKKVIYHNVGDKEALVAACYKRSIEFYDNLAAQATAYRGTRLQALCVSWHGSGEASLREDLAPIPLAMGFEPLPDSMSKWIRKEATRLQDVYYSLYLAAQSEGSVRKMDARPFVPLQARLYRWLPKWLDSFAIPDRDSLCKETVELLRVGLATD